MIARMRQTGRNYIQIAAELNRVGFGTARGGAFQATQVIRLASKGTDR